MYLDYTAGLPNVKVVMRTHDTISIMEPSLERVHTQSRAP